MTPKLDLAAIETYAKQYASKICDDFFATNQSVSGQQLLSLSGVQQVNLFVVSSLFDKWKTETNALRSPYFNFEDEQVQKALATFMNTLSKSIAVKRDAFEPLLAEATSNTLVLALSPHHYFDQILRDQPDFILKAETLKNIDKYTRLNQFVSHGLVERMDTETQVYVTQAVGWLNEICVNDDLFDNPDDVLAQFSEVIPVQKAQLFKKAPAISPEEVSFFDMALSNTVAEPAVAKTVVSPPVIATPTTDSGWSAPIEAVTPKPITPVVQVPAPVEVVAENTLNDRFATVQSLNDLLKQDVTQTVGEQSSFGKIESIAGSISLNQKYVFINSLFHGDTPAYQQAIEELDACSSLEAAKELMNKKYAPKYLWRMSADDADTLFEMVKRKFS